MIRFGILCCVLALANPLVRAGGPADTDVTEPPAFDQFLVIPLRVHVLTSETLPEVNCHLTDADVTRIVGKINRVWNKAGVHWGLESIVREPAAQQERLRILRELLGEVPLGAFSILRPAASQAFDGFHVYCIHELVVNSRMIVNGVWMNADFVIVHETAQLQAVTGGIDEPVPRVTAHELGHALGLKHRQDETNLLASGTTGTLLNRAEVETARRGARKIKGTIAVDDLRHRARKARGEGRISEAKRDWSWLAQIPGAGAEEARRQRDELETAPRRRRASSD